MPVQSQFAAVHRQKAVQENYPFAFPIQLVLELLTHLMDSDKFLLQVQYFPKRLSFVPNYRIEKQIQCLHADIESAPFLNTHVFVLHPQSIDPHHSDPFHPKYLKRYFYQRRLDQQ